ncbi:MAG: hypothetical protein JWR32_2785 [Mycobacterium sp.]|jgi:hypothetical protein|nr:hypothetical protein [Mycobacterium sp.]
MTTVPVQYEAGSVEYLAWSKWAHGRRVKETPVCTLSDDLRTLSYEVALFYPLVTMNVTRLQPINTGAGAKPGLGPFQRVS